MAHALTALLALVIALITLLPLPPGPAGVPGLDKLAHFVTFAVLAVPLAWRFPHLWRAVALMGLVYGGLIEIVQPYMGRSAEWADLVADGLGAVLGAWGAARIGRRRRAV
ncbi:VanZ family protein [Roseovarius ramblicola]|uniref:VanZ family protein n=1 Tax=Roseovarius ramblicola TaxID=2022336 RepID=A0ABV5HXS2_9RHOB